MVELLVRPHSHVRAGTREGEVFSTSISASSSRSWTVRSTNVWVKMRSVKASVRAIALALASFAVGTGLVSAAKTKSLAIVPTVNGCLASGDMWGAHACHINSAAAGSYFMEKSLVACFCIGPLSADKSIIKT